MEGEGGSVFWSWDDKNIGKNITLSDKGLTMTKSVGSDWNCGFGDKVMTKGMHRWKITVEKYPSGDKSGIIFGTCEESTRAALLSNGQDVLYKKTVYGLGGSGNNYQMTDKKNYAFKEKSFLDFELDMNEGKLTIFVDG